MKSITDKVRDLIAKHEYTGRFPLGSGCTVSKTRNITGPRVEAAYLCDATAGLDPRALGFELVTLLGIKRGGMTQWRPHSDVWAMVWRQDTGLIVTVRERSVRLDGREDQIPTLFKEFRSRVSPKPVSARVGVWRWPGWMDGR